MFSVSKVRARVGLLIIALALLTVNSGEQVFTWRFETMPRVAQATGFNQLYKQARQLLTTIKQEIRSRETELRQLKQEGARLASLAGHQPRGAGATSNGKGKARTRTDWTAILGQLPTQFKASDLRKIRELKVRRSSEIYAGITRWMQAGSVKRKDRGLYERVK
jgi:hypothetical protein